MLAPVPPTTSTLVQLLGLVSPAMLIVSSVMGLL